MIYKLSKLYCTADRTAAIDALVGQGVSHSLANDLVNGTAFTTSNNIFTQLQNAIGIHGYRIENVTVITLEKRTFITAVENR